MQTFASPSDVQTLMGRDLTSAEVEKTYGLLERATVDIQAFTGQHLFYVEDDVVTLWPGTGAMRLPERPVVEVSAVTYLGSAIAWELASSTSLWSRFWHAGPVVVTYTHGYETVPDALRVTCAAIAAQHLSAPVAGVTQVSLGTAGISYGDTSRAVSLDQFPALVPFRVEVFA